jgi:hypothetical protein
MDSSCQEKILKILDEDFRANKDLTEVAVNEIRRRFLMPEEKTTAVFNSILSECNFGCFLFCQKQTFQKNKLK